MEDLKFTILVIYYAAEYPLRAITYDHLHSFRRYSPHRVVYLNVAVREVPDYFFRIPFDLVIFHPTVLGRWYRDSFWRILSPLRVLKRLPAVKVILPQDEFLNSDLLVEFIAEFGVDGVFSVSPPSEWPKIYAGADFQRVKFTQVLTGYLDSRTTETIDKLAATIPERPIDIGYRAYRAEPWLGRFGWIKAHLADLFVQQAPEYRLNVDISTAPEATFLGLDWYRFLLKCKYTIGVEGGSSILDRSGAIKQCTEQYLAAHPGASFEEVEQACFAGLDGSLRLEALSPRHLEACSTRTCQILVEGYYNGVLRPGEHYLELKRDFSNLSEVLHHVRSDELRAGIVQRAYLDVVASQRYTYRQFVAEVIDTAMQGREAAPAAADQDALFQRAARDEERSWRRVRLMSVTTRPLLARLASSSSRVVRLLKRIVKGPVR